MKVKHDHRDCFENTENRNHTQFLHLVLNNSGPQSVDPEVASALLVNLLEILMHQPRPIESDTPRDFYLFSLKGQESHLSSQVPHPGPTQAGSQQAPAEAVNEPMVPAHEQLSPHGPPITTVHF